MTIVVVCLSMCLRLCYCYYKQWPPLPPALKYNLLLLTFPFNCSLQTDVSQSVRVGGCYYYNCSFQYCYARLEFVNHFVNGNLCTTAFDEGGLKTDTTLSFIKWDLCFNPMAFSTSCSSELFGFNALLQSFHYTNTNKERIKLILNSFPIL